MPCLEALHLVDQAIFEFPDNSSCTNKVIALPRLSTLHLCGTIFDCNALTSHLLLAAFVNLELQCTEVTQISEVRGLLDFVKTNFDFLDGQKAWPMRVRVDSMTEHFFLKCECETSSDKPKPSVFVGVHSGDQTFFRDRNSEIYAAMIEAIPPRLVKRIRLRNRLLVSSDTWIALLNRMSEVRALDVYFDDSVNVAHVLGAEAARLTTSNTSPPPLYCPKLRILTFNGISFSRRTSCNCYFSEALLDCLKKRCHMGGGIKALAFNSCADVEQSVAMQFRNFGCKVHWDDDLEEENP
jgi:hypothetical protein